MVSVPQIGNAFYGDFSVKVDKDTIFSAASATVNTGSLWLSCITGVNANVPILYAVTRVEFVDN